MGIRLDGTAEGQKGWEVPDPACLPEADGRILWQVPEPGCALAHGLNCESIFLC